jgi:glyoxylase-like metal-dependent hydrolase (beta-lactamase superfamily II)
VPSNGHTPGHTSYLLSSGDEKLLLWGDIVHVHAVQLPHPEVTIAVDVDPKAAVASRTRLFAKAARERWLVAAAHLPFPGIGHLRKEEKGYSWVPVEYRNPVNSER